MKKLLELTKREYNTAVEELDIEKSPVEEKQADQNLEPENSGENQENIHDKN